MQQSESAHHHTLKTLVIQGFAEYHDICNASCTMIHHMASFQSFASMIDVTIVNNFIIVINLTNVTRCAASAPSYRVGKSVGPMRDSTATPLRRERMDPRLAAHCPLSPGLLPTHQTLPCSWRNQHLAGQATSCRPGFIRACH
jgi:hypothetical protein